jgi:hypothetical protein
MKGYEDVDDSGYAERRRREEQTLRVAQAALQRRTVGLGDQRDYFEKKATDPLTPERERPEWQRLADEITTRLGDRRDDSGEQAGLF